MPVTVYGVVPSAHVRLKGGMPVNEIFMAVLSPAHIAVVPLTLEAGASIVTIALPVMLIGRAEHTVSLKAITEYVVVTDGVTVNTYGLLVIPVTPCDVLPSVHVKLHGAVPVKTIDIVALPPVHTIALPVIVSVGGVFTITTALSIMPVLSASQCASLNAVI